MEKQKHSISKGFTLAEVLITLGIIGVVAALTLPTLIKNYQKHVIETGLKRNFAIMQNALLMARAEYGDPEHWKGIDQSSVNAKSNPTLPILNTYLIPYLNVRKQGKFKLRELGYKTPIYLTNGQTVLLGLDANSTKYVLNDGSIIAGVGVADSYIPSMNNKRIYTGSFMYVDINGSAVPNTIGKDVFVYIWHFIPGSTISFHDQDIDNVVGTTTLYYTNKLSYEELLEKCKTSYTYNDISSCGALIQHNNWKFPKDYPLKF